MNWLKKLFGHDEEIQEDLVINRATTFHFTDALGYSRAFGGIFGEKSV